MAFKLQANLERKISSDNTNLLNTNSLVKDEKLIENLRKLVKDYLEIVS